MAKHGFADGQVCALATHIEPYEDGPIFGAQAQFIIDIYGFDRCEFRQTDEDLVTVRVFEKPGKRK